MRKKNICPRKYVQQLKMTGQMGRGQAGVKGRAAHLVAVLVFVPAPQHLQPLAGSLHLRVLLLWGWKRTCENLFSRGHFEVVELILKRKSSPRRFLG